MNGKAPVRVRFAPSPTGYLHVGNARTALFNWLFARHHGGKVILRIEDTDVERSEAKFEGGLIEDLRWLGLDWDEGPDVGGPHEPYRQSERMATYHCYGERLLEEGKAYLCFCTIDQLERERQRALAEHRQPHYSGRCRNIDPQEAKRRHAGGEPAAVRLRIPEHPIRFHDIVHGDVEFANEAVSDLIIIRSGGMPVYNYVVVVDDAEMKITHVIRGDDHLSNTPKQVALYEALGWNVPEFAHLSTILGSDRERLSKRHGAVSIANFREIGVLPEALLNYMALLGWAPTGGTREVFKAGDLIKEFSLERVTPSPAVFDMEKLYWLNRHYLKEILSSRLMQIALPMLQKAGYISNNLTPPVQRWLDRVVELLAPSIDRIDQLPERAKLIFDYDPTAAHAGENQSVLSAESANRVLYELAKAVADQPGNIAANFKSIMNAVKASTGVKGKELFHPIRIALTGSHAGPEFDKLIPILEEGSTLDLPQHVLSVRERVAAFAAARGDGAA